MTWERLAEVWAAAAADWPSRLLLAGLIGLAAWLIARQARSWLGHVVARTGADPNIRLLVTQLLYWLVLAVGLLLALGALGVDQSVLLPTFGAAGLALGLAAQDILKSFFAGLYLLFERPFVIGDEIQVKEHIGRVESVGFRATSIRTADNVRVVVPNTVIFTEVIGNRAAVTRRVSRPRPRRRRRHLTAPRR